MRFFSFFSFCMLMCFVVSAQLDTVYRLTKLYNEDINGLKPHRIYAAVTNEQGDTVEFTEYFWSVSDRWMPYMRVTDKRTEDSSVYMRQSWDNDYRLWNGIARHEEFVEDTMQFVLDYVWDFDRLEWKGDRGRGSCKTGELRFFDETMQDRQETFKNIRYTFKWDDASFDWYCYVKEASNKQWDVKLVYSADGSLTNKCRLSKTNESQTADGKRQEKFSYIYDESVEHALLESKHIQYLDEEDRVLVDSSYDSPYTIETDFFGLNYTPPFFNELQGKCYLSNVSRRSYSSSGELLSDSVFMVYSIYDSLSYWHDVNRAQELGFDFDTAERNVKPGDAKLKYVQKIHYNQSGKVVSDSIWGGNPPYYDFSSSLNLSEVSNYAYLYDTLLVKACLEGNGSMSERVYKDHYQYDDSLRLVSHVDEEFYGDSLLNAEMHTFVYGSVETSEKLAYKALKSVYHLSDNNEQYDKYVKLASLQSYLYKNLTSDSVWFEREHLALMNTDITPVWVDLTRDKLVAAPIKKGDNVIAAPIKNGDNVIGEIRYLVDLEADTVIPHSKTVHDSVFRYDADSETFVLLAKAGYNYNEDKQLIEKVVFEYDESSGRWGEASSTHWYYSLADLEAEYEIEEEYVPTAIDGAEPGGVPLRLYPTIASHAVWFENGGLAVDASVYSAEGKLLQMHEIPAKCRTEISVAGLSKGLYYLKVSGQRPLIFIKAD